MPVAPEVYAQRAYAKFNLKQYKEAVEDYEKANKYSFSEEFNPDIVGVKSYYLPYDQTISEFDNLIALEKNINIITAKTYTLFLGVLIYS